MAQDQYLALHLPFDEGDGATSTYDYSPNRADGAVNNAHFEVGKQGNCIAFDGTGTCEVTPSVLNLSQAFTLCAWVKLHDVASQLIVLLNYAGADRKYTGLLALQPETWYYISVTRDGNVVSLYLNSQLIERAVMPSEFGNPIGLSLCSDNYNTELAHGCLDEVKLYQKCLTQAELMDELDNIKQLAYLLDGVDFKSYGVHVSKSKGLLDGLKMKEPLKVAFDGYHGEAVDLSRPRFEPRDITLECFIKAEGGKMAFIQAAQAFIAQFSSKHRLPSTGIVNAEPVQAGLHRLVVDVHPTKALVYEVYMPDGMAIDKEWNDKKMVGTFTLTLREPEPVKRVLKHMRTSEATKRVSITLTSTKLLNIYWGDGTTTQDVCGTDVTVTHDYVDNGDYYISLHGVVEDIEAFATNAIVVWEKL